MGRDKSFRDGIASLDYKGETQFSTFLSMPSRREIEGRKGPTMYTGTLIDELIATVERTESRVDNRSLRLLDSALRRKNLLTGTGWRSKKSLNSTPVLPGWHKWRRRRA